MSKNDVPIIALILIPWYVAIAWVAAREYGLAAGIFYAVFWYSISLISTHYWVRYIDKRNKELIDMFGPAGSCDRGNQDTKPLVKLDEKDRKEIVNLYQQAQSTPVITTGIGKRSMADSAWDDVRKKMDHLGRKYGFDPTAIKGINPETGEVKL